MLGLGFSEIIFIGVLALIFIGPKQLPEVARTLGRFLNELRRSTNVLSEEFKNQVKIDPIKFKIDAEPIVNKENPSEIKINENEEQKKDV